MIALPIFGALLESLGIIIEKKILKFKGVNYKNYTIYGFLAIVLSMLPFIFFVWRVDKEALLIKNLLIFFSVIILSVFANLLIFYALQKEKITEFEPAWLMQPLFTILLAFIIYSEERNFRIILLALIASSTLVITHIKKKHLNFEKPFLAVILGSFFFALELVISKYILPYYSPFAFYFLRCFFIFLIAALLFKNSLSLKGIDKKAGIYAIILGLMWASYRAIIYYGYEQVGIVFTTLLFILSPVFLFVFAIVLFKERPTLKQTISIFIILCCVILAIIKKN